MIYMYGSKDSLLAIKRGWGMFTAFLIEACIDWLIRMKAKSSENWEAGYACLTAKRYNAAANRFYYSIFQAVLWYAQKRQGYIYKKGESRVHGDMMEALAKAPMATKEEKRTLKHFCLLRETADYQTDTPREQDLKDFLYKGQCLRERYFNEAGAT